MKFIFFATNEHKVTVCDFFMGLLFCLDIKCLYTRPVLYIL